MTTIPAQVRVPTVYQMTSTDCGAACLSMIMRHYGRSLPLETLRRQAGVGRDGTTAAGIKRAAELNHVQFEMRKASASAARTLAPPFIAHWEGRHFVVVEGRTRRGWRINDPAQGRIVLTEQEWQRSYSGVALMLVPGPDFEPSATAATSYWRSLRGFSHGSSRAVLAMVLLGVAATVPNALIPALASVFIDQVLVAANTTWLPVIIVALLGLGVAVTALRVENQWVSMRLQVPLNARLSGRLMWHLLRLPLGYFDSRPTGGLIQRLARTDDVAALTARSLPSVLIGAFTMAVMGIAIALFSPVLAGCALVAALANFVALLAVSRRRVGAAQCLQAGQFRLAGHAMSGIRHLESIKAQGGGQQFLAGFMGFQADVLSTHQHLQRVTAYFELAPGAIHTLTTVALLVIGAAEVMSGNITVGAVVACMMLTSKFLAPIPGFLRTGTHVQDTHATVSQLDDVLCTPAAVPAAPLVCQTSMPRLSGRIRLREVTFRYDPAGPALLDGIDLDIPAGAQVAIVGPSGSGKSTLCNVICGLVEPATGNILFDDLELSALPRESVTSQVLKVDQSPHLFAGTVADNVRMWRSDISDQAVHVALRDAQAEAFLVARGGPQAAVDSDGTNYSGGQIQRLAIARALVNTPAVLILDEATSALDADCERAVVEAVRRRSCTTVRVVHQFSSIADTDQVIVLHDARIVECGTKAELLSAAGQFAEMAAQHG